MKSSVYCAALPVLLGGAVLACDRTQPAPPPAISQSVASSPAPTVASSRATSPSVLPIETASAAAPEAPTPAPFTPNPALVAARPYKLGVPDGLDSTKPSPLVLFLHGYGAGSKNIESLGVDGIARARRFIYAIPDGTPDSKNMKFWNASDACCDFEGKNIDDVAYLSAVLADAMSRQRIDPQRVYVVGYSNGGFMAHRLACELSGSIAGIASLAGASWKDSARCATTHPVTVVQVHGDADKIVRYGGGYVLDKTHMQQHPGARAIVDGWASRDRCGSTPVPGASLDLEDKHEGAETVTAHYEGCADGTAVELWTEQGANHFISQKPRAIDAIVAFLLAHPKRG